MSANDARENTDRDLWHEFDGDRRLFVTEDEGIGISVGGHVIVKSAAEWHRLAATPTPAEGKYAELIEKLFALGYPGSRAHEAAAALSHLVTDNARLTAERDTARSASVEAEREADGLRKALEEFLAAEEEVDREARRAERPGANAWSSAPTVRRIYAVKALRETLSASPTPRVDGEDYDPDINGLDTIARQIQSWLDWHRKHRAKENLVTDGSTSIMGLPVPSWPSHSQFEHWIALFKRVGQRLAASPSPDPT